MNWHSEEIQKIVRNALAEDIGAGDASTAATTPPNAVARAHILARQTLVCAGLPLAEEVFRALDPEMEVASLRADGSFVEPGTELVEIRGNPAAILTGERTALNFLSHLCGIATYTRRFVEQLATTKTRIRDTRKTTPGLRVLEKYAVKMGGGTNHRFGLYDAILLKENHMASREESRQRWTERIRTWLRKHRRPGRRAPTMLPDWIRRSWDRLF